jgi:hypothetical protein
LCFKFRTSIAPIVVRNAAQNLQWIFKALIAILQKYFSCEDAKLYGETFNRIQNVNLDILSIKETFNTELGSSTAMVFVLVNTFNGIKTRRSLV